MPCRTLKPPRFGACVRGCLRRPVIRELLTGYLIRGRFSALSWVVSVWSASKSSSSSSSFFLKEDEFPVSLEPVFPTPWPRDFMFGTSCRSLRYFCWLLEWLKENLKWQEIFLCLRFLTYCYHFSINKTENGKKRTRAYPWTPCGTHSRESRNFSVLSLRQDWHTLTLPPWCGHHPVHVRLLYGRAHACRVDCNAQLVLVQVCVCLKAFC